MSETRFERFERLAAQFYRDTGMMAPGKDVAAMSGDTHTHEERVAAWLDWIRKPEAPTEAGWGFRVAGRSTKRWMCSKCRNQWATWKVSSVRGDARHCRYACAECLPRYVGPEAATAAQEAP